MAAPTKQSKEDKPQSVKHDTPDQNIKSRLEFNKTWTDRMAQFVTSAFGSIKFLCLCISFFVFWITWNLNFLPALRPFDPYPFPALEMVVSLFAIVLSVSVLISQNMEGRIEKIRQQIEFEVNVRAENEITKVLAMLHEMQKKMGIKNNDTELEIMKESIDLEQLQQQMDDLEASD